MSNKWWKPVRTYANNVTMVASLTIHCISADVCSNLSYSIWCQTHTSHVTLLQLSAYMSAILCRAVSITYHQYYDVQHRCHHQHSLACSMSHDRLYELFLLPLQSHPINVTGLYTHHICSKYPSYKHCHKFSKSGGMWSLLTSETSIYSNVLQYWVDKATTSITAASDLTIIINYS